MSDDWVEQLSTRVRGALTAEFTARFLNEAHRIADRFNATRPGYRAIAQGRAANVVTLQIGKTALAVQFDHDSRSVYERRPDGVRQREKNAGSLVDRDGVLVLNDQTPEQYAQALFWEIAATAVHL